MEVAKETRIPLDFHPDRSRIVNGILDTARLGGPSESSSVPSLVLNVIKEELGPLEFRDIATTMRQRSHPRSDCSQSGSTIDLLSLFCSYL